MFSFSFAIIIFIALSYFSVRAMRYNDVKYKIADRIPDLIPFIIPIWKMVFSFRPYTVKGFIYGDYKRLWIKPSNEINDRLNELYILDYIIQEDYGDMKYASYENVCVYGNSLEYSYTIWLPYDMVLSMNIPLKSDCDSKVLFTLFHKREVVVMSEASINEIISNINGSIDKINRSRLL